MMMTRWPLTNPRDRIEEMLRAEDARLKQMRLDHPHRGNIAANIRALEDELDALDDGKAT
jgi:hypothetical protein